MGKSRKKKGKKPLSSNLKFELYGILLLLFSAIALAREGPVGKSIAFLFRVLIGNLEPVLPVVFMYVAVFHFMIRRSWPSGWSVRATGVVLFLLGWMISLHRGLFLELMPDGGYTAGWVVQTTWDRLMSHITAEGLQFTTSAGGGLLGGLSFAALYMLFGSVGAKLIEFTMYAIGLLLITGWSYVQMIGAVRKFVGRVLGRIGQSAKETASLLRDRSESSAGGAVTRRRAKPAKAGFALDDDDEFDEETMKPEKKPKASWFQRITGAGPAGDGSDAAPEAAVPVRDEEPEEQVVYRAPAEDVPRTAPAAAAAEDEGRHEPVFVDFLDQVRESVQRAAAEPEPEEPAAAAGPALEPAVPAAPNSSEGGEPDMAEPFAASASAPAAPPPKPYVLPPFHLLSRPGGGKGGESADAIARENARKLETTLESFGVRAKVLQVVRGPAVTRYEIQPDVGVKVSRIVSLTDDIALALAAKDIRMEAPIPGKSAIGIEVPNTEVSIVSLREVMETSAFHESDARLTIALGRDISGQPIVANLAKMPHLLVAGATGSGKSVCINGIITSILYKAKPDEVKFLMIDPKMVELNVYNGIPHLLAPVVTDPRRASLALKKIVVEMEKRYEAFSKSGTRNIEGYNAQLIEKGETPLPYIVVIVDELADLMMVAAGDVEDAITRLAQMARAAGIHLIIATQRPSVDVITGVIKANIPSRIAFGVSSQVDSRTILDMVGAEKLLGRGDMLFVPVGASKAVRVQGAFLSDNEVEAVVTFCRDQEKAQYREELVPEIQESEDEDEGQLDELFDQAVGIVLEAKQASVSLLQRRMRIGYTRAARLIDQMEAKGVVGPYEGSKPREVLVSLEQYQGGRLTS
ncbi:DNA translocase FtsK [Paenibacillus sp.]|uniref:DNA translocase FtsK n=1 Tax=Paenibacillus sp. TaxID=58172 RepID=UPI002D74A236|nr:DNA translocase FtsK [Paenibacillus sp.]HZG86771.1 DNA translocase FtsK [Paenibacillus sp.]